MNLNLGPIGQVSRSVKDITQSETWYKTVLGLPHLFTFGKLAFFAELKSRGVEFVDQPHLIHRHADGTEEYMSFFKDPEGRLLALMSQVKQAA